MAFLFDRSSGTARPHRGVARHLVPPIALAAFVAVYLTRTGVDLMVFLVGGIILALLAREASDYLADHIGAAPAILLAASLVGGITVLSVKVEPVGKAVMKPVRSVVDWSEARGYGSLLLGPSGSSVSTGASAGPAPSPGAPGGTGRAAGGGGGPGRPAGAGVGGGRAADTNPRPLVAPDVRTETIVSASPSSATKGDPITLTAEVRAPEGIPDGRVAFVVNGVVAGRRGLNTVGGAGVASLRLPNLKVGAYDVTARYRGGGRFLASESSSVRFVVEARQSASEKR